MQQQKYKKMVAKLTKAERCNITQLPIAVQFLHQTVMQTQLVAVGLNVVNATENTQTGC